MSNKLPTWIHYLPEVGRPLTRQAESADYLFQDACRLRKQADELETRYRLECDKLSAIAHDNWTGEEVQAAIEAFQNNQ